MQQGRVRSDQPSHDQADVALSIAPVTGSADAMRIHSSGSEFVDEDLADAIAGDASWAFDRQAFSAAVDAALGSQGNVLSWKLLYFAPAVAAIVAGAVLQTKQKKSRYRDEVDAFFEAQF